jgi:site-specific DNA-methyltransferase (adenine-specific)
MADVQLFQGDCLEILPTLPAQSVEAIITDLPYGTTQCAWDAVIPFEPMWEQVRRILKPHGAFVTSASQPFTSKLIASNWEWFKYCWVWEKSLAANFMNAKNKPLALHEDVVVFSDGTTANGSPKRMTYNPQGIRRVNKSWSRPQKYPTEHNFVRESHKLERIIEFENYPGSVIRFSNGNNGNDHPTQKPVALYEYLVLTYTNPGETVMDFCMGSGTTGVACVKTGRNFIGIEQRADYFAIAQKRIAAAQSQPALFEAE